MTLRNSLARTAALVAFYESLHTKAGVTAQQLPYNPTTIIRSDNGTVFVLSPASNQFYSLDTSESVDASNPVQVLDSQLPFVSSDSAVAVLPLIGKDDVTVWTGDCAAGSQEQRAGLWRYNLTGGGEWAQLGIADADTSTASNFLAAGFTFSPTNESNTQSLYVFGGMCPDSASNATSWTSDATYSNTMLTAAASQNDDYTLAITGQRAPPIAEAGLTITPLVPTSFNTSSGTVSQQQNFVLIGGHTQNAFINMSQIALFSLPEQSWAFLGIDQPDSEPVEPRSGHTAITTRDGSKIVVFGGWVGTISNPASPQLAVLEVGAEYGGQGDWKWTIPEQIASPFTASQGVYGHGATMLDGDVMMISGGYPIAGASVRKRNDVDFKFYNVSSGAWMPNYSNPNMKAPSSTSSTTGLKKSDKIGIGAGLGVGIAVLIAVGILIFFWWRRKQAYKRQREKELRALALGAERSYDGDSLNTRIQTRSGPWPEMRSASWGSRQEKSIESSTGWSPFGQKRSVSGDENSKPMSSTGALLNIPSPTRGLRRSLHSRGPAGFGTHFSASAGPGSVFRIDEEEEERSRAGSVGGGKNSPRPLSDPFKDPPVVNLDDPAAQRQQEVATWVEDWQSAAESMNISRSPSKANSRTYSNLSAYNSSSSGNESRSGAVSPEKSDRTNSNLSERSMVSLPSTHRSITSSITRTLSQRSASAGHALFIGAAAAMSKLASRPTTDLERTSSKRSISHGDLSAMAARRRADSASKQDANVPRLDTTTIPAFAEEKDKDRDVNYYTPPESPIKDYKRGRASSLTQTSKKAFNKLGKSTKRVLTGTNEVDVNSRITDLEIKSGREVSTSPIRKDFAMDEASTSGTATANFWTSKQGQSAWLDSSNLNPEAASGTMRRRSGRISNGEAEFTANDEISKDEDWDIETAIQQRVVQVMFTVPKEKLRVVNADVLSIVSRSESNASTQSQAQQQQQQQQRPLPTPPAEGIARHVKEARSIEFQPSTAESAVLANSTMGMDFFSQGPPSLSTGTGSAFSPSEGSYAYSNDYNARTPRTSSPTNPNRYYANANVDFSHDGSSRQSNSNQYGSCHGYGQYDATRNQGSWKGKMPDAPFEAYGQDRERDGTMDWNAIQIPRKPVGARPQQGIRVMRSGESVGRGIGKAL